MDNASKALIIAGAVLIAVMLVSVGVLIYNNAIGVVDTGRDSMDRLAINLENKEFEQYLGTNKRPTDVKELIQAVERFNQQSEYRNITLDGITSVDSLSTTTNKNKTYDISAEYDDSGYLNKITIEVHS